MNGNKTAWRGRIFLVLFGFVSALILGEVFSRFLPPFRSPDELRAISLEYETATLSRTVFPQRTQTKGVPPGHFVINAKGYRGEDFSTTKSEDTIRIVLLGGSAAFDLFAPQAESWPSLVEQSLHEAGYPQVELINAAIPGHATWDSVGRLYSEIWLFEPDYVLIYHGWNDIKYFNWLTPEKSLLHNSHPPETVGQPGNTADPNANLVWNPFLYTSDPVDELLSHSQFYLRLRQQYWLWQLGDMTTEGIPQANNGLAEIDLNNLPDDFPEWGPKQFALNLRLLADISRDIGAVPVFITQARLPTESNEDEVAHLIAYELVLLSHEGLIKAFAATDAAIEAVAEEKEVPLIDLSDLNGRTDFFLDHVHTTTVGSRAIAERVATAMAGLLDENN